MLLGRDRELAEVGALIAGVTGRGGALVVRGPSGIGKSALLAAASALAEAHDVAVTGVSGVQSETHLPFAGLHQLLQPHLDALDRLPVRQRQALLGAFGLGEAVAPEPFLIALAVLNLLGEAADGGPMLVAVDDVQWLDAPTIETLGFVARRLRSEPIVLLLAVRDGHPTGIDVSALPELHLAGLDPDASEALLDARAPDLSVGLRWRVLAEAAGNPLALVELPVALTSGSVTGEFLPLTARLEKAFAVRLAEMPEPTRALLLAAAANDGHALAEAFAAAHAAHPSPDALRPAVEAGLVAVDGPALRFRHPLVRSAVYHRAPHADRRAVHAALADVHAASPDRRAWHLAAALDRPDEAVARELEEVAARARRRGAITVAVAALRRAAEVGADPGLRAERLLRAAELAFELGRVDQVAELLVLVEPAVHGQPQRARLAWLQEVLEEGRTVGPVRIRQLITTIEAAARAGDRALALNLVRAAAIRSWWADPGWELRRRIVQLAEGLAEGDDDPVLILAMATAAPIEYGPIALERLTRLQGVPMDGAIARLAAVAATTVGAHDIGAGFIDAAIADLRAEGRLGVLTQALVTQACVHLFCGDRQSALLSAEEGQRLAAETAQPRWHASALAVRAMLAGMRGEEEQGVALAVEGELVLGTVAVGSVAAMLQHARGIVALCAGQHDEAFARLWRVFDPADVAYHPVWRHWLVSEFVEAAVLAGERETAVRVMAEIEEAGRKTPAPLLHVGLRHARALLAPDDEAEALYRTALDADLTPWPTSRARLLLSYGTWLRRRRRILDARGPLRAARDALDALGHLALSEKARTELRASGEASDLRVPSTADALTPQELHIARLAAAGLTNREIGQQLYLSHRTVSTHLYRLFPKLGITARAQLRDALGDDQGTSPY
ncbi:AAA family ATPase [Actinocorallia sp. A-T 12471]|uniref:AAA family ATPase n=1 Tax=Actinocorallia sp. A-T 12471 TaxID=3089813 RepID=UPI0029CE31C1|nr:AAA family ATPase [Actinocorallia sp. A-T 12471]MDX6740406.1 AAA family ATPase [Actinocorallia sp. A-T 12471]